jgi:hypothetical protein
MRGDFPFVDLAKDPSEQRAKFTMLGKSDPGGRPCCGLRAAEAAPAAWSLRGGRGAKIHAAGANEPDCLARSK